jgi:hypothetical protein
LPEESSEKPKLASKSIKRRCRSQLAGEAKSNAFASKLAPTTRERRNGLLGFKANRCSNSVAVVVTANKILRGAP